MASSFISDAYVRLLDEGTDVFRPVKVQLVSEGRYVLLAPVTADVEPEKWEIPPGTPVRLLEYLTRSRSAISLVALISN